MSTNTTNTLMPTLKDLDEIIQKQKSDLTLLSLENVIKLEHEKDLLYQKKLECVFNELYISNSIKSIQINVNQHEEKNFLSSSLPWYAEYCKDLLYCLTHIHVNKQKYAFVVWKKNEVYFLTFKKYNRWFDDTGRIIYKSKDYYKLIDLLFEHIITQKIKC